MNKNGARLRLVCLTEAVGLAVHWGSADEIVEAAREFDRFVGGSRVRLRCLGLACDVLRDIPAPISAAAIIAVAEKYAGFVTPADCGLAPQPLLDAAIPHGSGENG